MPKKSDNMLVVDSKKAKQWIFLLLILCFTLSAGQASSLQNWIVVHEGVGRSIGNFGFSQLHFSDGSNGWAASFQDPIQEPTEVTLIHTGDGGLSWDDRVIIHKEMVGIDYKPQALYFLNSQLGWVGGRNNMIHTIDGGENWQIIKVDYDEKPQVHTQGAWRNIDLVISRIYFISSQEGWVAGHGEVLGDLYGPFILYTRDGGDSWEAQLPVSDTQSSGQITSLDFVNPRLGWVAGWETRGIAGSVLGIVLHTQNGGVDWDATPGLSDVILDIVFADSQNGWALTHVSWVPSHIHHTADGGHSWSEQGMSQAAFDKLQDGLLYALDFANSQDGWGVGTGGVIVRTRDGGMHWTLEESFVNVTLVDVQYVAGNGVFALGNDGTVLRLSLEEPSSLFPQGRISTAWGNLKKGRTDSKPTAARENE